MSGRAVLEGCGIDLRAHLRPSELSTIKGILKNSKFNEGHLEIGTAAGGTLKEMIGCYGESRPRFFVIDPMSYFPEQSEIVCLNLESAGIDPTAVTFWIGTSADFLSSQEARDKIFNFIFIDADHRHYHVMLDLSWCDRLAVGGYVCLHDNSGPDTGVGWAVRRFLSRNRNFEQRDQVESLSVLRKNTSGRSDCVTSADLAVAYLQQRRRALEKSILKRFGPAARRD